MKRLEISEFCGYKVVVTEDENYIDYELVTDSFYNKEFSTDLIGSAMLEVNCGTLRVLREAFQRLIRKYYYEYENEGLVVIITPENGETMSIRKCHK